MKSGLRASVGTSQEDFLPVAKLHVEIIEDIFELVVVGVCKFDMRVGPAQTRPWNRIWYGFSSSSSLTLVLRPILELNGGR